MKRISRIIAISLLMTIAYSAKSQDVASSKADSTGLPGDNFSLPGALEMFKNAKSLEEFEKFLNQESNNVNNLDLNDDGKIDYVRVVDNSKEGAHAIVLQVPVNKTEYQDIAVIEVEKQGEAKVSVQIVGDEDIYGENIIYEPKNDKEIDNGSTKGGPSSAYYGTNLWFNVWYWPCIQFIYGPSYMVWVSPWYWDYYPYWWRPWNPYPWGYYYHHCHHYHNHYHHSYQHYGEHAYHAYQPHRRSSEYVVNRHRDNLTNYRTNTGNSRRDNMGNNPINKGNNRIGNRNVNQSNFTKPRTGNDINNAGNINSRKDKTTNKERNNKTDFNSNPNNRNDGNIDRKDRNSNKQERNNPNFNNSNSNNRNNGNMERKERNSNSGNVSPNRPTNRDNGNINRGSQNKPSRSSENKPSKTPRSGRR